jgi:predicted small secreted protein
MHMLVRKIQKGASVLVASAGTAALLAAPLAMTGCEDDSGVEEAVDDTSDAVEDAADETGDALDDAADEVEDAVDSDG